MGWLRPCSLGVSVSLDRAVDSAVPCVKDAVPIKGVGRVLHMPAPTWKLKASDDRSVEGYRTAFEPALHPVAYREGLWREHPN